ncbi:hypothetical protein K466DRAFT_667843 [Polyporus arcularius HHB13444]|uniref:Uncharacterized protein n=1 Tax=Polyporus arcularius HHB13444 TaxID=1314778 RepID=A0A5C3NRX8_9APHY|nr:hypothetical protein K466DRAFT_667843 [Polyporus arcularius HHB13444]
MRTYGTLITRTLGTYCEPYPDVMVLIWGTQVSFSLEIGISAMVAHRGHGARAVCPRPLSSQRQNEHHNSRLASSRISSRRFHLTAGPMKCGEPASGLAVLCSAGGSYALAQHRARFHHSGIRSPCKSPPGERQNSTVTPQTSREALHGRTSPNWKGMFTFENAARVSRYRQQGPSAGIPDLEDGGRSRSMFANHLLYLRAKARVYDVHRFLANAPHAEARTVTEYPSLPQAVLHLRRSRLCRDLELSFPHATRVSLWSISFVLDKDSQGSGTETDMPEASRWSTEARACVRLAGDQAIRRPYAGLLTAANHAHVPSWQVRYKRDVTDLSSRVACDI